MLHVCVPYYGLGGTKQEPIIDDATNSTCHRRVPWLDFSAVPLVVRHLLIIHEDALHYCQVARPSSDARPHECLSWATREDPQAYPSTSPDSCHVTRPIFNPLHPCLGGVKMVIGIFRRYKRLSIYGIAPPTSAVMPCLSPPAIPYREPGRRAEWRRQCTCRPDGVGKF